MAVSDLSDAVIFYWTNLHSAAGPINVHLSRFRLLYDGNKLICAMEFSYYCRSASPVSVEMQFD